MFKTNQSQFINLFTFNRFFVSTVFLLFTLSLSGNALAYVQETGIEITGQASVFVEPNQFSLTLSIKEQGRFTDKLRMTVDNKSNQVVNVAKNLGVEEKNINSASVYLRIIKVEKNLKVHGLEVNQRLRNNQESQVLIDTKTPDDVIGEIFELSRTITVTFNDISDYDQFLNAVIKIGVTHISPLTMTIEDSDKYYQQALLQAVANAKDKALLLAKKAGKELSELVYIKETSNNHYRPQFRGSMMVNSSFEHSSDIGTKEITASVLVNYSIE